MKGGFYDYASKGPAIVLPFVHPFVRAWVVRDLGGDNWRGELIGGRDLLDDGPTMTESGPLYLVLNALQDWEVRQGLPLVVLQSGEELAVAA